MNGCISTRRRFLRTVLAATAASAGHLNAAPQETLDRLADIERVMHAFVVHRMLDQDGLCRSFLCAATVAPWTNADLAKTDQRILTDMFQNSPDKAGCLTYENALMATGEFAVSQIVRYRVTKDNAAREMARRAIRAILGVVQAGRHYMPGWLPKPFGGLRTARDSHETSTDQYTKAIVALHTWRPLADEAERSQIDRFFVDAAEFFIARKFRLAFRHRTIVTADTHQHALGLFVPLVVLAAQVSGQASYREHLATFRSAMDAALKNEVLANFNMTSLIVEGYQVALQAGHRDPTLARTIVTLWERGARRIDETGAAYASFDPQRREPQSTRLAAAATIVKALEPATRATELAVKVLGREREPQTMTHSLLPETIDEVAITSWLVAYWRLREFTARNKGRQPASQNGATSD